MSRAAERIMTDKPLDEQEAEQIVTGMMEGRFNESEMAAVLSVLQYRGATVEEITGFAKGMQKKSSRFSLPFPVMDTCGTGGDRSGTFNVSTASAILLSSMKIKVAKHGNRSVSSATGSADVLDELGIPFQKNGAEAEQMLKAHHLAFLFAPLYHSAMKHVAPVRKQLGIKTIFNMLGPLTNPAGATHRIIGVYSVEAARKMAEASLHLGIERAMFVCGEDGLDEITVQGKTHVIELQNNTLTAYEITPEDAGLKPSSLEGALVGTPAESAAVIRSVFERRGPEAAVNLVLLNAGAGLYVQGNVSSIKEGVHECRKALGGPVLTHLGAIASGREEEVRP